MKCKDIIEALMVERNMSRAALGRALGMSDKNKDGVEVRGRVSDLIAKRINQKNISVNILVPMLNELGYTLAVVPKGKKLQDNEYEVTVDE